MRCLVCCCWRQINGTYVKQLEGFLQFGGSLTYWKTMATYNVRAPPTGCKQNITRQVLKIPPKYHQQKTFSVLTQDFHKIHLQQTFWWVRLNSMHESIYCIGKKYQSRVAVWKLPLWQRFSNTCQQPDVVYPTHLSAGPTGGAHTPQE